MQLHNLQQGSDAWHQFRLQHHGASEAAAMLGISPTTSRTELLAAKKTGIAKEFSRFVQERVLDRGHEVEALARPIVEELIGDDLYPVTASRGKLSASCDGLDMAREIAMEHKQWSKPLAALAANGEVPEYHMAQCQQILYVTGAKKVIFTVSDGTRDNFLTVTVTPDDAWFERLERGWEQFEKDLAEFVPLEVLDKPVAAPVTALPAVSVQVSGEIAVRDNFALFETALRDFIDNRLIREPATDQEFADLDLQIKALKNAESALDAAEAQMLAQVSTVDTIKRTKDMLHKLARDNRLMAEKLLEARKLAIKGEIVAGGVAALAKHIRELNAAMPGDYMPVVPADFGGAVKGKRTVESLRDAVNTELARAKIAANEIATRIAGNLKTLDARKDMAFLFADVAALVLKQPDDLAAVMAQRVSRHEAEQAAKEEAQRERIRAEEAAKLQREADEKRRAEEAEAQRAAQAAIAVAATPAPEVKTYDNGAPMYSTTTFKDNGEPIMLTPEGKRSVFCDIADDAAPAPARTSPAIPHDSGARLSLGQINERLAPVAITVAGLSELGFDPVEQVKASRLYRESDFSAICAAIVRHVQGVALGVAA